MFHNATLRITRTIDPPGVALVGKVDASTAAAMAAALAVVAGEQCGDVHIDLSGLVFIDLDGLRTLTGTAAGLSRQGRRLVIDGLAEPLRRVIGLVGWDATPGLEFGEDPGEEPQR